MALIVMVTYDTPENGRAEYTEKALASIRWSVSMSRHRLVVVDNGTVTTPVFEGCHIRTGENLGTARGFNRGARFRNPGEYVIKIDNDIVVNSADWVDEMEYAMRKAPSLGILGLKRKDLRQTPYDPDPNFRSELVQLPHEAGERWVVIEKTNDIMGSCTMFSPQLLDTIGGLCQPNVYGFDDVIACLRSRLAGFENAFLPHIDIDHIDRGGNYAGEKVQLATGAWAEYKQWHDEFCNGTRSLYVEI